MIVEIISVGTELLLGDILNTDVRFLAKIFAQFGFDIYHTSVVGDNKKRLIEAIELAVNRSDIVVTSGGLGSTSDDISKECVIEYLGLPVVEDSETINNLYDWFKDECALNNNKKVFSFPINSKILRNGVGISPGAWIPFKKGTDNKYIIILPGPPKELEPMVLNELIPILKEYSSEETDSLEVKIGLLGEYKVYQIMKDLMEESTDPTYAPYVKNDGVLIRITSKGVKNKVEKKLYEGFEKVKARLGKYIINTDGASRESTLVNILSNNNLMVSLAESLTGGLISATLINVAGASKVIDRAFVVYSDQAKEEILGVRKEIIDKHSAVSYQTCRQMLLGLKNKTGCDVGVAVTGYAGPTGEEVGHVFIGILIKDDINIYENKWKLERQQIRNLTVNHVLDHLILNLKVKGYE